MNYFNYAIKCIIRNVIYKLMKPRNLAIIIVSIIIIFLLSNYTSVFGYTGNNDYTDKNNTIIITYDSICNDLVYRLRNVSRDNDIFIYFNSSSYGYYCYYGDDNGRTMTSQTALNPESLHIIFYSNTSRTLTLSSIDDTYQGMTTTIYNMGNIEEHYVFNGNTFTSSSVPSSVAVPGVLVSYRSKIVNDFLTDNSSSNTQDIVGAINQQTNTIQEQTQVIQEQTESINSTDFDENEVNIDTTSSNIDNSVQQGLFTTIFTSFNNAISSDNVEYLNIPLVNNQSLSIPSNIVSSHLGSLSLLINAFWFYVFGLYAFKFVNNLIIKIKDGSILDGYTSNEVITSDMM